MKPTRFNFCIVCPFVFVLTFCFLLQSDVNAQCSKNDIWSVFVGSHELGDVNDKLLTEQVSPEKNCKQVFSRRWDGGSSSRSVSIVLTIYKTAQAARDIVEKYGKGGSGIVPVSPQIGDAGYWTNTMTRPYYLICRKNVTISFFSRYARSGYVGPQDSYLKLMVDRLDQLGCVPTVCTTKDHIITISKPIQCSPNPAKAGDNVTCSVNAVDSQGHSLNYAWSCTDGKFSTNNTASSNVIWVAPINKTPQIADYEITATISCPNGLSVQSSYKQMNFPDDRAIQITVAPRGDPNPVEPKKDVTCSIQATHPDGLPLTYKWRSGQGSFVQSDPKKARWLWQAPENITAMILDCPIEVIITSSDGLQAKGSYVQKVLGQNMLELTILNKAELEKTHFLTGQKITITGKLTNAGEPVIRADIGMVLKPQTMNPIQHAGTVTRGDGSFSITYEVPRFRESEMAKLEEWLVTLTAKPIETEMGTATAEVKVQIIPLYFQLKSVRLVQVIETPLINGERYLAADKKAALRVYIACPNLADIKEEEFPTMKVTLDIGYGKTDILKVPATFQLEKRPNFAVNHSLKPIDLMIPPLKAHPQGPLLIGALVDPDFIYTDPQDSKGMFQGIPARVKKMKHLSLRFIPVGIPTGQGKDYWNNSELRKFLRYCKLQENFIRKTYPLPSSHIHIKKTWQAYNPWRYGWSFAPKSLDLRLKFLLLKLGLEGELEGRTLVAVLPNDNFWLENLSDSGVSIRFSSAVLVRLERTVKNRDYFEPDGLTAHEVGHVHGLNLGSRAEEYDTHPEPKPVTLSNGKQVTFGGKRIRGLILKNNHVYDLTDSHEFGQAFPYPIEKEHVLCFMGNCPNRGEDAAPRYAQWVCPESYAQLFKDLMDPPGEPMLYVSGFIQADGAVTMDRIYEIIKEPGIKYKGDYSIECLSATGDILSQASFGVHQGGNQIFGVTLPAPRGITKVVLKYRDLVKAEKRRSANKPVVKLLAPNGGEKIVSTMNMRWEASDADNDSLVYSLLYSNDGGNNWVTLESELDKTSYDIPSDSLAGGNECLLKVIASDGFNTSFDISDNSFSVRIKDTSGQVTKANVSITVTAGNAHKAPGYPKSQNKPNVTLLCITGEPVEGKPVGFVATASDQDAQDKLTYQWYLDGQPVGWTGLSPKWRDPKPGTHNVAIMVSDGKEKVRKVVAFTVAAAVPPPPASTTWGSLSAASAGSIIDQTLLLDSIPPTSQNQKTTFSPGDMIYIWVESRVLNEPHKLEIVWIDPSGGEVKRETFDLRGWGARETVWSELQTGRQMMQGRWEIKFLIDGRVDQVTYLILEP